MCPHGKREWLNEREKEGESERGRERERERAREGESEREREREEIPVVFLQGRKASWFKLDFSVQVDVAIATFNSQTEVTTVSKVIQNWIQMVYFTETGGEYPLYIEYNTASNDDNTAMLFHFKDNGNSNGGFYATTSSRMDVLQAYFDSAELNGSAIEAMIDESLHELDLSFVPYGLNSTFIYDSSDLALKSK